MSRQVQISGQVHRHIQTWSRQQCETAEVSLLKVSPSRRWGGLLTHHGSEQVRDLPRRKRQAVGGQALYVQSMSGIKKTGIWRGGTVS
eukprot:5532404-Prymnesium_polylepis.1